MAHFYGTLQGNRGEASRLGSKSAGLRTYAASWQGAVSVCLYYDEETGVDMARVSLTKHRGAGEEVDLYHGPVSGAIAGTDDAKAARALKRRGGA